MCSSLTILNRFDARLDFVGVVDLYDESWCALQHTLRGKLPADCTCDKMGVPARRTRTHVMLWHSHEVHETHSVKPHPSSDELSDATKRLIDSRALPPLIAKCTPTRRHALWVSCAHYNARAARSCCAMGRWRNCATPRGTSPASGLPSSGRPKVANCRLEKVI